MGTDIGLRRKQCSSTQSNLTVILPIFNEDLSIHHFVNEWGEVYMDFKELILSPYTNFYFIEYAMVWRWFEKWYKANNFEVIFRKGTYSGHSSKKDYIVPSILLKSFSSGLAVPKILKARGGYKGKSFRFLDAGEFARSITYFNITEEKMVEIADMLRVLETEVYTERMGFPNSIASASRQLFPKPSKVNNPERTPILYKIKSAYRGGLYYVDKTLIRFPIIYDYDIRSMYPYILLTQRFPDPNEVPQEMDGFVEVDNISALAVYHVSRIEAQRKPEVPYNTVFNVQEEVNRVAKFGFTIGYDGWLHTRLDLPTMEGWITSIDYLLLKRDYDIKELKIDKTVYFDKLILGNSIFSKLGHYFVKKEQSKGVLRTAYKLLIDSYSGSLGAIWSSTWKLSSLEEEDRQLFKLSSENPGPVDIAMFMNAYGRLYITKLAKLCKPGTIQSIDTDGIFTTEPATELEKICGDALGDIRLDKVMYDAVWYGRKQYSSREDSPDAEITPHIAGLPAYLFEEGRNEFKVPQFAYSLSKNEFEYKETNFTLIYDGEEIKDYEKETN